MAGKRGGAVRQGISFRWRTFSQVGDLERQNDRGHFHRRPLMNLPGPEPSAY